METRAVGSLQVSVVGLGCNSFGREVSAERAREIVAAALDAGINHFDTADVYGNGASETLLGDALRAAGKREEVVIATKFGRVPNKNRAPGEPLYLTNARPEYVHSAARESLWRLGTDYIDLYLLHIYDDAVPIAETLGAMSELVGAGLVREIGCSQFDAARLAAAAQAASEARFTCLQNEYSLLRRGADRDTIPECERLGIAFVPFLPLAHGMLTGKYRRGQSPPEGSRLAASANWAEASLTDLNFGVIEELKAFAAERGHTLLELAVSGLLGNPVLASVICGATSGTQVRANAAAGAWRLTDAERAAVDRIAQVPA